MPEVSESKLAGNGRHPWHREHGRTQAVGPVDPDLAAHREGAGIERLAVEIGVVRPGDDEAAVGSCGERREQLVVAGGGIDLKLGADRIRLRMSGRRAENENQK